MKEIRKKLVCRKINKILLSLSINVTRRNYIWEVQKSESWRERVGLGKSYSKDDLEKIVTKVLRRLSLKKNQARNKKSDLQKLKKKN